MSYKNQRRKPGSHLNCVFQFNKKLNSDSVGRIFKTVIFQSHVSGWTCGIYHKETLNLIKQKSIQLNYISLHLVESHFNSSSALFYCHNNFESLHFLCFAPFHLQTHLLMKKSFEFIPHSASFAVKYVFANFCHCAEYIETSMRSS